MPKIIHINWIANECLLIVTYVYCIVTNSVMGIIKHVTHAQLKQFGNCVGLSSTIKDFLILITQI